LPKTYGTRSGFYAVYFTLDCTRMASAINRVLKYARTMLATKDRMPTVAEVEAFLAKGPRLSQARKAKLIADYKHGASTVERIARLEMKYLPRVRKQDRAI
jgi:hypothetical protein